jgi:hypothetical protein
MMTSAVTMDEAIAAFKREFPNWYCSITECWVSIHGHCSPDSTRKSTESRRCAEDAKVGVREIPAASVTDESQIDEARRPDMEIAQRLDDRHVIMRGMSSATAGCSFFEDGQIGVEAQGDQSPMQTTGRPSWRARAMMTAQRSSMDNIASLCTLQHNSRCSGENRVPTWTCHVSGCVSTSCRASARMRSSAARSSPANPA